MNDDPTEDMVRREIAEAVRILKEDGFHVKRHFQSLIAEFRSAPEPPGPGDPPPPKDPKPPVSKKKRSLLWDGPEE